MVRPLSKSQRRWLGAALDYEGHIPRGKRVFLELGNTQHELVLAPWRMTGVGSVRRDRPEPGEKPFWRWRVGAVDAVGILRQVIPHLKGKQRDAIRLVAIYERHRRVSGQSLATLLRGRSPRAGRHPVY